MKLHQFFHIYILIFILPDSTIQISINTTLTGRDKKVFIEEISSSRNGIFIKMINHFSSIQYFILRVNLDRYHSRLDLLLRKEATESYQIYANQK